MNRRFANSHQASLGRRSFLRLGAAVAAGALVRPSFACAAAGKNHPALGTYPRGVGGNTAFIGITVPLTGPYAPGGNDELRGCKLAIGHLNGGGLVDKMSTLNGKGVLGKRLVYKVGDSETKPNSAVQAATAFIRDHDAIMIIGCISSSVAVALGKLGAREHVIYMGSSASNDVTGKDCSRYGFRSQICFAYPIGKALASVLGQELGKNLKAVYLVPDDTYGHTVFDSVSRFIGEQGWTTAGKVLYPLGTSDFSSYLLNIANTDADVFINIAYGNDAVNSIKQARRFGILAKMKLVVANISAFMARSLGPDYVQGRYRACDHQMLHPMPVVVGKSAARMKGPEDFYDVVKVVPGKGILPSCETLSCKLGPYT